MLISWSANIARLVQRVKPKFKHADIEIPRHFPEEVPDADYDKGMSRYVEMVWKMSVTSPRQSPRQARFNGIWERARRHESHDKRTSSATSHAIARYESSYDVIIYFVRLCLHTEENSASSCKRPITFLYSNGENSVARMTRQAGETCRWSCKFPQTLFLDIAGRKSRGEAVKSANFPVSCLELHRERHRKSRRTGIEFGLKT